jgi:hypothetical protein
MKPPCSDNFMPKNFTFDSCIKQNQIHENQNEPARLLIPGLERQPAEF